MSDKSTSGIVQVAIALIGVLGSLGVAYVTTGATFKKELQENVKGVEKLTSEQTQVDQRIAEMKKQVADAESKNLELQQQVSQAVSKNNELEQNMVALKSDIEASKQEVTKTKNEAIEGISNARIKALSTIAHP
jgi:septal ring factor EnvC (AmiA/AmiB activator)